MGKLYREDLIEAVAPRRGPKFGAKTFVNRANDILAQIDMARALSDPEDVSVHNYWCLIESKWVSVTKDEFTCGLCGSSRIVSEEDIRKAVRFLQDWE